MNTSCARVHLRQLCCTNLASDILMPDIMKTLKNIIRHQSGLFMWFDRNTNIKNFYIDIVLPDVLNLYFGEYRNLKSPYGPDLAAVSLNGKVAGNYRYMPKEFYKTDMFNLVCRPYQHHFILDGIIRDQQGALGGIALTREKSQRPFSDSDEINLRSILPFLEHSLKNEKNIDRCKLGDEEFVGTIVADNHGNISYISLEARETLFWSYQQSIRYNSKLVNIMDVLPGQVKTLCNKLNEITLNKPVTPPCLKMKTSFGYINFRAYRLSHVNGRPSNMVSINVLQQKPVQLRMMQRLRDMPLSPRQREVAVCIGMGESSRTISKKMGISLTTYRDHVHKIFEKLGINRREELFRKVWY